jgi:hypothetical protein
MHKEHPSRTEMSTFRDPRARARRKERSWLWFWCVLAAVFVLISIGAARDMAGVLIAGFLAHPHS